MGNLGGFNANKVDISERSYEPIPPGYYRVAIVEASVKTTKAGTGTYVNLKMQVLDGKHQNRYVFERLTLTNPNETAVRIGREQLAMLCIAVGKPEIEDTSELLNRPFRAKVAIESRRDDPAEKQNVVKGFSEWTGEGFAAPEANLSEAPW